MNKKQIAGAVVAAILFIVVGASSVFTKAISKSWFDVPAKELLTGGVSISFPSEPFIGVVEVNGTIQAQAEPTIWDTADGYQHVTTMEYIDRLMADDYNTGILLRVDSPGGTVYESEELYMKLREYQETTGRPVRTYMEHYAASGGYMISAPSDKIYANSNTTTGSIGVILSGYDMSGLYEKLGIRAFSITSGANKDMSEMNEEQIGIYQEMVNESYERFVEIVADGRGMTTEEVKALADGRIYTAKQALNNRLIDEISLYDDMVDDMMAELDTDILYTPNKTTNALGDLFMKIADIKPKSEAEVLTDLAEKFGNGVPMYYAEQLQ